MLSNTSISKDPALNRAFWMRQYSSPWGARKSRACKDRNKARAPVITSSRQNRLQKGPGAVWRLDYGDISVIDNTHRDKEGDDRG
jgi:hypothetical protein